jgi:hypothetical protein
MISAATPATPSLDIRCGPKSKHVLPSIEHPPHINYFRKLNLETGETEAIPCGN